MHPIRLFPLGNLKGTGIPPGDAFRHPSAGALAISAMGRSAEPHAQNMAHAALTRLTRDVSLILVLPASGA